MDIRIRACCPHSVPIRYKAGHLISQTRWLVTTGVKGTTDDLEKVIASFLGQLNGPLLPTFPTHHP